METKRRFQRPQHVIKDAWGKFDTPLKRREDIDWAALEGRTNDYGMTIRKHGEVKSEAINRLVKVASEGAPKPTPTPDPG